jgi:hypothetical protein
MVKAPCRAKAVLTILLRQTLFIRSGSLSFVRNALVPRNIRHCDRRRRTPITENTQPCDVQF